MTRRVFLQAIPGTLPVCTAFELPPQMSLGGDEFEQVDAILAAEMLRTPDREVTLNKARAILRSAVREKGPQMNRGARVK